MIDYSPYLQLLLKQAEFDKHQDTYFLTVYQPNTGFDKQEMKLRLKSAILQEIKQRAATARAQNAKSEIIKPLNQLIEQLESLKRGVAVFAKFDLKRGKQVELRKPSTVVPLTTQPIREIKLGRTYDLDQLIHIAFADIDALVVNLHRQEFEIYQFHDSQLKQIYQDKNWYIREKPKHYLEKFGPTGKQDGIYHTTGSDKLDKTKQKENQTFMGWLQEYLLDEKEVNYKHLIVFYTTAFKDIIDELKQALHDRLSSDRVEFINKNLTRKKDVRENTIEVWRRMKQQTVKKKAAAIKEKYYHLKQDWNEVTRAARRGQIKTLYLKPDLDRAGYLVGEKMLYSYPKVDSKQVNDLSSWLVKLVTQQGGEVVVLEGEEFEQYPDVMAELRFSLQEE